MNVTDLIARLREYGLVAGKPYTAQDCACHDAADALEALQARLVAAERERGECVCAVHGKSPHQLICLYCYDTARTSHDHALMSALRAERDEAVALLREARMGVKNSAVQFGYPYTEYVDRIDAFLAKVSPPASTAPTDST